MSVDLKFLQENINIYFTNTNYLKQAFTHSSYKNENKNKKMNDNERLEFLGDAVLELTVSDYLFNTFPNITEGELTKLRASIVCEASLVKFAESLKFGDYIMLGKGEELSGGRNRPSLLADVFEAFVGVLYLEKGLDVVKEFFSAFVFPKIDHGFFNQSQDFKSQLQEYIHQNNQGIITYNIIDMIGPAHDVEFHTEVIIDGKIMGKGIGKSKKESEQVAAQQALIKIGILNKNNK